jgi:hypothetical protein
MAQHFEITGEFEIEVRDYNQMGYNIIRKAEGTTTILPQHRSNRGCNLA